MKRSLITTLVLFLVLSGLLGWYFIYEKNYKGQQQEAEEKAKRFVSLEKQDIQFITLTRTYDKDTKTKQDKKKLPPVIKFNKNGNDWFIVEPVKDRADQGSISSLLNTITTTVYERVVAEEPKDLERYGLAKPTLTVSVQKDSTSAAQTIAIGTDTPLGYGLYIKTNGGKTVYKATRSLKHSIDKSLTELRNKALFDFPRGNISEIEIQTKKGNITLKNTGKDKWLLTRNHIPALSKEVNQTLNSITNLRAVEFPAEKAKNLAAYGLSVPQVNVTVTLKDKKRVGFLLGKKKDRVFLKRNDKPVIYEVKKHILDKVDRPSTEYQDYNLADFSRFKIKRIKLEYGKGDKQTVELLKENGNWSFPIDLMAKVDGRKVDKWLATVQDSEVSNYVKAERADMGLTSPQLTVRLLEKKDDKEIEVIKLTFGNQKWSKVFGKRDGLDIPFQLKAGDYKKVAVKKEAFLETKKEEKKQKVDDKGGLFKDKADKQS